MRRRALVFLRDMGDMAVVDLSIVEVELESRSCKGGG